jgi:hypothetical protein
LLLVNAQAGKGRTVDRSQDNFLTTLLFFLC